VAELASKAVLDHGGIGAALKASFQTYNMFGLEDEVVHYLLLTFLFDL
jgi:hypothetical protein